MRFILWVMILFLLAACGGGGDRQPTAVPATPTPQPTLTLDERLSFPAGQVENPIRMLVRPVDTVETRLAALPDAFDAAAIVDEFGITLEDTPDDFDELVTAVHLALGRQVSAAILERTSLYVDVIPVADYAEALAALCQSGTNIVTAPWLDGVTYAAALAQNCGQPALQVARADSTTPEATGDPGLILANAGLNANNIAFVQGRVFCRLGINDFYSWFLPALLMEQAGLDPLRTPEEIRDYDTLDALLEAVAAGACDATGIAQTDYREREGIRVVTTTPPFPYGVLMYPIEIQLGVRLSLNERLPEIAAESEALRLLLGQDSLLPAAPDDFSALMAFIDATGYDLAQLGK